MLQIGIREKPRLTITHFQSGLNFDMRDGVELLPYNDFNNPVQLCIRVKDQPNRKFSFRKSSSSNYPNKEYRKDSYVKNRSHDREG